MQKTSFVILLGAAVLLTGCEATKEEVMAKRYNLIVHNVSSIACSFVVMDTIEETYEIEDVLYHQDVNGVTCADYNHTEGETCKVVDARDELGEDHSGIGNHSCVLGSDKKPGKNFRYFDALEIRSDRLSSD